MPNPCNDPFSDDQVKTSSDEWISVPNSHSTPLSLPFLFSSFNSPAFDHQFSTATDPSYPSLFEYSSELFPPPPQTAQVTSTVSSSVPSSVTITSTQPTAPPVSSQPTTSVWSNIARDAQMLRDRWNDESAALQRRSSMESTPAAASRPTHVEFADFASARC